MKHKVINLGKVVAGDSDDPFEPDLTVTDKNGLTWGEWVKELFELQNCDECGQDEENHTPAMFNGLWFARCKPSLDNGGLEESQ